MIYGCQCGDGGYQGSGWAAFGGLAGCMVGSSSGAGDGGSSLLLQRREDAPNEVRQRAGEVLKGSNSSVEKYFSIPSGKTVTIWAFLPSCLATSWAAA